MLFLNALVILMALWIVCNYITGAEVVRRICALLIAIGLVLLLLNMLGVLSVGNPHV